MKYREPTCVRASAIFRIGLHLVVSVSLLIALASQATPLHAQATTSFEGDNPGVVTRYDNADGLLQFASGGHVMGFGAGEMYVAAADHVLRAEFVGARPVTPTSKGEPPESVAYVGLWDGVTAVYERDDGGVLKSTYHVAPGASAERIRLRYNVPVRVDESGGLLFDFDAGQMRESAPVAWQDIDGVRVPVDVAFHLLEGREVGFDVGAYDPAHPLVIDPTLVWNTFLGGDGAGLELGIDEGRAIALDGDGNIYVIGSGNGWGTPVNPYNDWADILVAKLNGSGVLQWHTFLGSPINDWGNGIALDSAGNIYITGCSNATWGTPIRPFAGGDDEDAFVAKLDNSGVLQWNTFLGSAHDGYGDVGEDIAVDAVGNIYVTGYSDYTWGTPLSPYSGYMDAFVAKLNNSGALQWNTFLGASHHDYGNSITLDGDGNVYVAGYSYNSWGTPVNLPSGSGHTFVAKLDGAGAIQWNTFLDSSAAWDCDNGIAVDGDGNVYVVGRSSNSWGSPINPFSGGMDAFVAKLNNQGELQWNTFIGSAGGDEEACSIAVDGDGNIYVAVRSYYSVSVVGLNNSGELQWDTFVCAGFISSDAGDSLAVDADGNVYVTGTNEETWGTPVNPFAGIADAFAARLNGSGVLQWNTFIGGPGWDDGNVVAVDDYGNVYVAGTAGVTWGMPVNPHSGDLEAFVAKLNDSGELVWHTFLGTPTLDFGKGIAVDRDGNVYVAGYSKSDWGTPINPHSMEQFDVFVAKLDGSGVLQWNTFMGPITVSEYGGGILAVDGDSNVYVTGVSEYSWGAPVNPHSGASDIFVAKLNGGGVLQWNTFLGSEDWDIDGVIAVDGAGNAYLTGASVDEWGTPVNPHSGSYDVFAAKLNENGVLQWNTFLGSSDWDEGLSVAADRFGNVYLAGVSGSSWGTPVNPHSGSGEAFAAKLDNNGLLQWNTFLGSGDSESGRAIAVDTVGNVYVAGSGSDIWGTPDNFPQGGRDAFVAGLSNDGALQWNTFLGSADRDLGYGVTVDNDGDVYVVGASDDTWGTPVNPHSDGSDAFAVKYDVLNTGCWARINNDTTDYYTVQSAIDAAVDGDTVKVAGYCTGVENRGFVVHGTSYVTRTQTAIITESITLQGGYTTTNWIDPDPVANPTTLDAEGQGRVIYIEGPGSPTVEGFRITGGDATDLGGGAASIAAGGGIYVIDTTAVISNNYVFSNTSPYEGAGMTIENSDSLVTNNTIISNTSWLAAGISVYEGGPTISDNTVSNNSAYGGGGGLWADSSTPIISDNDILNNSVLFTDCGGVLLTNGGGTFTGNDVIGNTSGDYCGGVGTLNFTGAITGNTISGNSAGGDGGGVHLESHDFADMIFDNNVITGNMAGGYGGGMLVVSGTYVISSSYIFGNTASYGGGLAAGVHYNDTYITLEGNTIISNTATVEGGGVHMSVLLGDSEGTFINNVIAGNGGEGLYISDSSVWAMHNTIADNDVGVYITGTLATRSTVMTDNVIAGHTYGVVAGTAASNATLESTLWHDNGVDWSGAGTIIHTNDYTGDPAFVNPSAGDYHVLGTSAAIDRGVDAGVTVDIDGDARPIGTAYDLGADERASTVTPIAGLVAINDSPTVLGSDTTLTATITSGSDVTYSWDFGDDDTGSGAVVAHGYPAVGVYTAVVTASNPVSVMTATTVVTITESSFDDIVLPVILYRVKP